MVCATVALSCSVQGASWHDPSVDRLVDFQGYRFGLAPAEFVYAASGTRRLEQPGAGPSWRVFYDPTAPSPPLVLVQAGTGNQGLSDFPLTILRWPNVRDGVFAVLIKPMGGWIDQSAGLVWRARTPGEYTPRPSIRSTIICGCSR